MRMLKFYFPALWAFRNLLGRSLLLSTYSVGLSRVFFPSHSLHPASMPIALSFFFPLLSQKLAISALALQCGHYPGLHCLPNRLFCEFQSCSKDIFPRALGKGGDDICHGFPLLFWKQASVHICYFPDELPRKTILLKRM